MHETIILEYPFIYRTDEHNILVVKKIELPLVPDYPISYIGDMYLLEEGKLIKEELEYEICLGVNGESINEIELKGE